MRRWIFVLCALLGWLIATGDARAETAKRASDLTEAGKLAYSLGKYAFAIQAFEQAHDFSQHPALLFSIAQAYRQRWSLEKKTSDLARAISSYRRYVDAQPRGAHRREAEKALAQLEPRLGDVSVDDVLASAPRESGTRLAVTSAVMGAVVRIDGKRARKLPQLIDIAPGKHTLTVRASGYFPEVREIHVVAGTVYPVSVVLDPKPAKLVVEGPDHASVHVDGQLVGMLPLSNPLRLEAGEHFVAVTLDGMEPHARTVRLARGKVTTIDVALETTLQRKAAWGLVVPGAVGIAAGIAFGVVAVVEHRRSRDIISERGQDLLLPQDQADYQDAIDRRDAFRVASAVSAGVGFAVFLIGGTLFVLDSPDVPKAGPDFRGGSFQLRF